jgi:hypothetical protein
VLREREHEQITSALRLPLVNHFGILEKRNLAADRVTGAVLVQQALIILALLEPGDGRDADHALEGRFGLKQLAGERERVGGVHQPCLVVVERDAVLGAVRVRPEAEDCVDGGECGRAVVDADGDVRAALDERHSESVREEERDA